MDFGDSENIVCPYNKSHIIAKSRIQFHLTKCRKNYPLFVKVQCSYNNTHIVNKPEIEFHELYCEDRVVQDRFLYDVGDTACAARDLLPVSSVEMPDCEEDWDKEETRDSVLDKIKEQGNKKQLLRCLPGTTRSKRRDFRLQERVRFQNLEPEKKPIKTGPRPEYMNCSSDEKPTVPIGVRGPQTDPEFTKIIQAEINPLLLKAVGRGRAKGTRRLFEEDVNSLSYNLKILNVNRGQELAPGDHNYTLPSSSKAENQVNDNYEKMYSSAMSNKEMDIKSDDRHEKPSKKQEAYFNLLKSEEGFCQLPIPGLARGRAKK